MFIRICTEIGPTHSKVHIQHFATRARLEGGRPDGRSPLSPRQLCDSLQIAASVSRNEFGVVRERIAPIPAVRTSVRNGPVGVQTLAKHLPVSIPLRFGTGPKPFSSIYRKRHLRFQLGASGEESLGAAISLCNIFGLQFQIHPQVIR